MLPERLPLRVGDGTPPSDPLGPRSIEVPSLSDIPAPVPAPVSASASVMLVPLAPVVSTRPIMPPESLTPRSTVSPPAPSSARSCSTWSALNMRRGPSRNSRRRPSRANCLISSSLLPRADLASSSV